jgi:hypothetical protein
MQYHHVNAEHGERALRHELSSLARSNAGIVGSNPTQGMDVRLFCVHVVLCVGRGLATG